MELALIIGLLFAYLVLFFVTLIFILWLGQSLIFPAPFLPLPKGVVEHLINKVEVPQNGCFFDLGSGDGRVIRVVAAKYPTVKCIGVEKALLPSLLARVYSLCIHHNNIEYLKEDYNKVSLVRANIVFLYLWPQAMVDIQPKLKTELVPQAVIISCRFPFPGIEPVKKEVVISGNYQYILYFYRVDSL